MTQLTPAFKLTLLVSIGLHVAAIIQSGAFSSGHHQTDIDTRLNITLSPPTKDRTTSESLPKKPSRMKKDPQPVKKPSRPVKAQARELSEKKPVKPFKEALPQEVTQQRMRSGSVRSGISAEESYQSRLLRHLEQYKHYPFIARRRQLEGTASIRIAIAADGRLRDIECLAGSELFCEAAIQAARKAQPFPIPPTSLSDRTFNYAMEYKLR